MDYVKLSKAIKKEFPELTDDEISEMISQVPSNIPTFGIKPILKLVKVCMKDPKKLDALKKTDPTKALKSVQDDFPLS